MIAESIQARNPENELDQTRVFFGKFSALSN
jgi:hypothetical protein